MKGVTVSKPGEELIEGMREAVAHAEGAATGAREIKVELFGLSTSRVRGREARCPIADPPKD